MKRVLPLFVVVFAASGCKDRNGQVDPTLTGSGNSVGATGSARPDQLASDELLEGKESALGLVLPEGMKIIRQTPNHVKVRGPVAPESLANFIRKRVDAEVETGPRQTQFSRATVKAPVGRARLALRIEISVEERLTVMDVSVDERGALGAPAARPSADPDDEP